MEFTSLISEPSQSEQRSPLRIAPAKKHVLDILFILVRHRKFILGLSFGAALLTAVLVLVVPPIYTSTAVILPPQQSSSLSGALLGQLGMLSSLGSGAMGMDNPLSIRSPQETYIGILSSRTVADELIDQFHLTQVYHTKPDNPLSTWKALARHTRIESSRGNLIRISVDDRDPQRAADMANGYVDSLYRQNKRLALTDASQRRLFFEQQLAEERPFLNQAEMALEQTQEKTGIFELGGQAGLTLRSIAQLSAEITSREVQLQSLRSIATGENAKVQELESQIEALKQQRSKLEKGSSVNLSENSFLPTSKVPAASLEYMRKVRDLKYHETLNELLSKQYEMARVEEAKSPPLIQVVDRAIPVRRKTWPPRTLFTLLSLVLFFFLGCGIAILRDTWGAAAAMPENAERIARIKSELTSKRIA
jgi:tyrosine-protein kinase Etk/Wzc